MILSTGGVACSGGCLLPGGYLVWVVSAPGGGGGVPGGDPPGTATAAGGTHPTGIQSCNYDMCACNLHGTLQLMCQQSKLHKCIYRQRFPLPPEIKRKKTLAT